MQRLIAVTILSAFAMFGGAESVASQGESSKPPAASKAQPSGFEPVTAPLPPGCRKIVVVDPDCYQQCIADGEFSWKTCRQACSSTVIECDPFPPFQK